MSFVCLLLFWLWSLGAGQVESQGSIRRGWPWGFLGLLIMTLLGLGQESEEMGASVLHCYEAGMVMTLGVARQEDSRELQ